MTTVIIQPDEATGKDTCVDTSSWGFDLGQGYRPSILLGDFTSANNDMWRGLIQFDFSSIPSPITSATLSLWLESEGMKYIGPQVYPNEYQLYVPCGINSIFGLHRCLQEWWAGTDNGTIPVHDSYVSTGKYRNEHGHILWGNPPTSNYGPQSGQDYVAVPSATFDYIAGVRPQWINFNVTADVQSWIDGQTNLGWLIRIDNESTLNSMKILSSSSCSTPEKRPKVTIEYGSDQEEELSNGMLVLTNNLIAVPTTHYYRVKTDGWNVSFPKMVNSRYTITGQKDRCSRWHPPLVEWNYTLFCTSQEYINLKADFNVEPPLDQFSMVDVDGTSYTVYLDTIGLPKNLTPKLSGPYAFFEVPVTIRRKS